MRLKDASQHFPFPKNLLEKRDLSIPGVFFPPFQRDQTLAGTLVLPYNQLTFPWGITPQSRKFLPKLREKILQKKTWFQWQFCICLYLSTLDPFVTTMAGKLLSPVPPEGWKVNSRKDLGLSSPLRLTYLQ